MNHEKLPILEALKAHHDKELYSFHVPGHKAGRVLPCQAKELFQSLLRLDATEIQGLDDLYEPTGIIQEAEALLADYYRTRHSFFLVNGSTVGNLAMILASCSPGDTLLVQRNAHQSIFNALKLAEVKAVFLEPIKDSFTKMGNGLTPETVRQAIRAYPRARAIVVTHPNYYGQTVPLAEIINEAKMAGMGVLVDEAHGPHFNLGSPFPKSSLELGADMVVHSAHKMLPAMTMGAYLHLNSDWVPKEHVLTTIKMLQTSSPSYLILASLDFSRAFLANLKEAQVNRIISKIGTFKKNLSELGYWVAGSPIGEADPLKVILKRPGYSGFEIKERFEAIGIFPELATPDFILFALGLDEQPPFEMILTQLSNLVWDNRHVSEEERVQRASDSHKAPLEVVAFSRRGPAEASLLPLEFSVGRKAAETLTPYPPGVPLIIEGETITSEKQEQIMACVKGGCTVHGLLKKEGAIWVKVIPEL